MKPHLCWILSLLLLLTPSLTTARVVKGKTKNKSPTCGYENCPATKPGYLNVHLVSHSHDDIGWLKTVDQYYYGERNDIQLAGVQYTIDSVITELQKDEKRRFIYVETGFFWRWWEQQDTETKEIVKELVNNGQLEFISGGWVMNDEADAHYNAIIDQMTLGQRWLNDTFGACALPKVAWQIDPFGHSREHASLFASMGLDGLFFGRLDYQDKSNRRLKKEMEMIWSGSPTNLRQDAQLFTGVLFNGYNPPDGFCYDIFCTDDPINDDKRLSGYNVEEKVRDFIAVSKMWGQPYRSGNVLMTMGSDFQYLAAHTWYKNLDKLIRVVNLQQSNGSLVNVLYSTPSCYLQEVNRAGLKFKVKEDDFFPYASDPHAFWTGYFTSRPTLKFYTQMANNFLQVCKQVGLNSIITTPSKSDEVLDRVFKLQESLAVLQHHDAVSGTAKQHVTDDYSLRLFVGMNSCNLVVSEKATFCHQLNISLCEFTTTHTDFLVNVYNPLAHTVKNAYVRVPVSNSNYQVYGEGGIIPSQMVVVPREVLSIPGRFNSSFSDIYELVFRVEALGALSWTGFRVVVDSTVAGNFTGVTPFKSWGPSNRAYHREDVVIQNDIGLSVTFSGDTGLVKKIQLDDKITDLNQNFFFYKGMNGNNSKFEFRASGAYIFRPNSTESPEPTEITGRVYKYEIYKGDLVSEVHQRFTDWVSQVVRIYAGRKEVEFEWLVGEIPVDDSVGKEVVSRYTTNIKSNSKFYTDSNGRELLERKRNYRPTWDYQVHEPVAGNYYPVNSRIIVKDAETSLVVMNDRAQGGTSLNDGQVELMIHRRLLNDDAFGVGEPLNELAFGKGLVVRGRHWVVVGGADPSPLHRDLSQEIFMSRILSFFPYKEDNSLKEGSSLGETKSLFSPLANILPPNVHLLTLEPLTNNRFILRLENFYETGESLGQVVVISKKAITTTLPFIRSMRETTLSANQWKDEATRLQWDLEDGTGTGDCPKDGDCSNSDNGDDIVLRPMEIRSFVIGY